MNIALEKTEEFVDGVLKRTYGDAFVRGNNGPYLQIDTNLDHYSTDANVVLYIAAD